jgi:hypothetical protein
MTKNLLTNSNGEDNLQPGSMHQDKSDFYPSGKSNALAGNRIDRNTDYDKLDAGRSVEPVHGSQAWMLQNLPANGTPKEQPKADISVPLDQFDRSKRVNADDSSSRLDKLRGGMAGKEYGDTAGDERGLKLNPTKAVTRNMY